MPFTYKHIPENEDFLSKNEREFREMRVRADYEEMADEALNAIPIRNPNDFTIAIDCLNKILSIDPKNLSSEFHAESPEFNEAMKTVVENLTQPEMYVEQRENNEEYFEIIKSQIRKKIAHFSEMSDERKNDYIAKQNAKRIKTEKDKNTACAGESRRATHMQHMLTERETLLRIERDFRAETTLNTITAITAAPITPELDQVLQAIATILLRQYPEVFIQKSISEMAIIAKNDIVSMLSHDITQNSYSGRRGYFPSEAARLVLRYSQNILFLMTQFNINWAGKKTMSFAAGYPPVDISHMHPTIRGYLFHYDLSEPERDPLNRLWAYISLPEFLELNYTMQLLIFNNLDSTILFMEKIKSESPMMPCQFLKLHHKIQISFLSDINLVNQLQNNHIPFSDFCNFDDGIHNAILGNPAMSKKLMDKLCITSTDLVIRSQPFVNMPVYEKLGNLPYDLFLVWSELFNYSEKYIKLIEEQNLPPEMLLNMKGTTLWKICNDRNSGADQVAAIRAGQPQQIIADIVALERNGLLQEMIRSVWKEHRTSFVRSPSTFSKSPFELLYRKIQVLYKEPSAPENRVFSLLLILLNEKSDSRLFNEYLQEKIQCTLIERNHLRLHDDTIALKCYGLCSLKYLTSADIDKARAATPDTSFGNRR